MKPTEIESAIAYLKNHQDLPSIYRGISLLLEIYENNPEVVESNSLELIRVLIPAVVIPLANEVEDRLAKPSGYHHARQKVIRDTG